MKHGTLAAIMILLAWTAAAPGALSLDYEGSFNLPSASAWADYYAQSLVFVPDGNARPGNTQTVAGPTLLVYYNHNQKTVEVGNLPTPATSGLGTATWIQNASGGTYMDHNTYYYRINDVDSAGNLWDGYSISGAGPSSLRSDRTVPSGHLLGGTNPVESEVETGWYSRTTEGSNYPLNGVLRRGNGSGGNLTTDGTAVGAKFITLSQPAGQAADGYWIHVAENTRVDDTTMSSALLFKIWREAAHDGRSRQVQYVRASTGAEWFIVWKPGAHTSDSFVLDFYAGSTSGGGEEDPDYQIDIGPDIAGGAGWLVSTSVINYVAVDWATGKLYVLDAGTSLGGGQAGRIHVFTVVPEPATLGLLAGGFLPLLLRRRRR